MKKRFVAPMLRQEMSLAQLTLATPCSPGFCDSINPIH
jgi:hypothetical protein